MEKFSGPLARRYGTALFEASKDFFKDRKEAFAQENCAVQGLAQLFDKKVLKIFQTQALSLEQKAALLSTFLSAAQSKDTLQEFQKYLFNFFFTIIKHKRVAYIPAILDFYCKQSDRYLDIVRAQIISAQQMPKNTLQEFEKNIANQAQKKVVFSNFIDESLKCGFLIKIGPMHIDASLKSFLAKLNEAVQ